MTMKCKILGFISSIVLASKASAFVIPNAAQSQLAKSSLRMSAVEEEDRSKNTLDMDELLSKVPEISSSLTSVDFTKIKENLLDGEVGERGEAYAAAQFGLLFFILIGGIPVIGDVLMSLVGPAMMLAGVATIGLSVKDLGSNLSPWLVPAENGELVKDGLYEKMRHPQYAGILAGLAGFSIATGSASRLLLTAVLFYVFNVVADFEEEALSDKFSDYESYKRLVPGRFFPNEINEKLPWNRKEE